METAEIYQASDVYEHTIIYGSVCPICLDEDWYRIEWKAELRRDDHRENCGSAR